jgi:hypothetical protein
MEGCKCQAQPASEHRLAGLAVTALIRAVTASQIINEIRGITPENGCAWYGFVYQLDTERRLSGPEAFHVGRAPAQCKDPIGASRIRETIVRGFYAAQRDP